MSNNRRNFLKLLLTAVVTTTACPHKFLGKIVPTISQKDDKILGIFGINIYKYPPLLNIWGSVRVFIEGTIGYFPKVIVTRVPFDEFGVDFTALAELCPHEGQYVKDLDPDLHIFECSGHGTIFDAAGKYLWGPAAKDLTRFDLTFNGVDTIYIEIPALPTSVPESSDNLFVLRQNYPNPCSDFTTIEFAVEKPSNAKLIIHNLEGKHFVIKDYSVGESQEISEKLDIRNLPEGVYFYSLYLNDKIKATKKLIIKR